MPIELEAKFKVNDHDPIRLRLMELGAASQGIVEELNTIYESPAADLVSTDRGLRIRTKLNLADGSTQGVLTFKGPKIAGQFKSREEIETHVDDPAALAAIFNRLGYVVGFCFAKKRETWKLGQCLIELDEIPLLGYYIEIEGPDEQSIRTMASHLNIDAAANISSSYIRLLSDYAAKNGVESKQFLFPIQDVDIVNKSPATR